MGKPDVAVRNWLTHKERFADFFSGTIFDGRQVVLPEELTVMNSESDFIVRDKSDKHKDKTVQRYRDITMRWKSGIVLMILACEVQDKLHPVITLVFYYGAKEWDSSTELYDMFETVSDTDMNVLKRYVPNYKINLIEPTKIEDLSRFKTDLQMIFGVLKM